MTLVDGANLSKIFMCFFGFLNFVGLIVIFVSNRMAFHKIMTNDLKHLEAKVDQSISDGKNTKEKLDQVSDDVSYLRGLYDAATLTVTRRRRTVSKKKPVKRTVKKKIAVKRKTKKKVKK